jgi:hypothetical protein
VEAQPKLFSGEAGIEQFAERNHPGEGVTHLPARPQRLARTQPFGKLLILLSLWCRQILAQILIEQT